MGLNFSEDILAIFVLTGRMDEGRERKVGKTKR